MFGFGILAQPSLEATHLLNELSFSFRVSMLTAFSVPPPPRFLTCCPSPPKSQGAQLRLTNPEVP